MRETKKTLIIRDEIHGDMSFDPVLRFVVDHRYFQRLRYIKQLGLAEFVFPCATHTRFQHSLGASYLAGEYYRHFLKGWLTTRFDFEQSCGNTKFYTQRTFERVLEVSQDRDSHDFWGRVVRLAGMLHDIGHGPWSHTFEVLELPQDFSSVVDKMPGACGDYYRKMAKSGTRFMHEDISVLYAFQIFSELGVSGNQTPYFLPVAVLIHRKLLSSSVGEEIKKEVQQTLAQLKIKGGLDFLSLLGPFISGPFDVDRMDYIQRDGRNCGVPVGGIEWRRIVGRLMPCLADHPNDKGEPTSVVLVSKMKNQHVLDDFIFSLFQMYTQVYLHPKIVGLEESLKKVIAEKKNKLKTRSISFDQYAGFSDESFRRFLIEVLDAPEIDRLLLREQGATFRVTTLPADFGRESELQEMGYHSIENANRPMMKDGLGVFLFSKLPTSKPESHSVGQYLLMSWEEVSPVAKEFYSIKYAPKIWLHAEASVV